MRPPLLCFSCFKMLFCIRPLIFCIRGKQTEFVEVDHSNRNPAEANTYAHANIRSNLVLIVLLSFKALPSTSNSSNSASTPKKAKRSTPIVLK